MELLNAVIQRDMQRATMATKKDADDWKSMRMAEEMCTPIQNPAKLLRERNHIANELWAIQMEYEQIYNSLDQN
jgi:hypothetical protein